MNCHYVPESLTKPWCFQNNSVRYYDFGSDSVEIGSITTLFAEENTNTPKIEQLISKYVEAPLGKFKTSLVGKHSPTRVKNHVNAVHAWPVYRALFLYPFVQVKRFMKVKQLGSDAAKLDEMLLKGEAFLDQLVSVHAADHKALWVELPPEFAFFFPEVGFFQFPVEDPGCITKWTYGYAVPISPFVALATVSKTADENKLLETRHQLSAFSLGLNQNARRALIPPQAVSDPDVIKEEVHRMRRAAQETTKTVDQIRELVVKMYDTVGLSVGPKRAPGPEEIS